MKQKIIIIACLLYLPCIKTVTFRTNNIDNTISDILTYVQRFLPENPIILEAGGSLGEDTVRMKSFWPQATIYTFEPIPWSFQTLKKNVSHLTGIKYYNCALSNFSGTTNFYIDIPNNGASSIGKPLAFNESEFDLDPINVKCLTLKEWSYENNVHHIDFMRLDMEGHELYALEHGVELLQKVSVIYTEVNYESVRSDTRLYPELKAFLEMHGFIEVWKVRYGRFGDALFIKKELLNK